MEHHHAGQLSRGAFVAFIFSLVVGATTLAQMPSGPPSDTSNAERVRQQEMSQREMQLRNYGLKARLPSNRKQVEALAQQVEEDFSRILILHNEIARALAGSNLDYGFVSDAATEIKKRASRLQATLWLKPEGNEEASTKPIETSDKKVKDALISLCKQIKSFVTNPVIENPGTVSEDQLNKARQDLESVVELSSSIRKTADKLSKSHK
jgi:hypothetical protein